MTTGTIPIRYPKTKWEFYESEIKRLEHEKMELEKELRETYKELLEERKKSQILENILLRKIPIDVLSKTHDYSEIETKYIDNPASYWETSEKVERAKEKIKELKRKIEKGETLNEDELRKLVEIDIMSEKYPELKKIVREVIIMLEKLTPAEIIELKKGEIKELDENTLIRRRKDGVVEVIIL